MIEKTLFTLETPYRESLSIRAAEFGEPSALPCCAVVGSMRGNEVQQTFIASRLVARLCALEEAGLLDPGRRIVVIPSVNAFSMNIHKRFWPVDNTDINRMFPGYDKGETTQRIAAGLFEAVQGYPFGIQLASFYLRGRFLPHVRITDEGELSQESRELAELFGMPCVLMREPSTFDTTTLNYNWQVWDTHAFSLFSKETGSIDTASARQAEDGIVRFLVRIGAVREEALEGCGELSEGADAVAGAGAELAERGACASPLHIDESALVDVRSEHAGGIFLPKVRPGESVEAGTVLAEVLDTFDSHVKDELVSPVAGRVFFSRSAPLINQYSIAFKIAPSA